MPGSELTAQYEELRAQALASSGRGLGLTLFLREGMCAWIYACARSMIRAQKVAEQCTIHMHRHREDLPVAPEFTMLLAGLALHLCEEAVVP